MQNQKVNLLFKQEISLTESAAGVGAVRWFRINGAFDPDSSVGGGACIGFNQYATLFTSYRVHAMRIHVMTVGNFATASNAGIIVLSLTPNPRQEVLPSDPVLWGGEYMAASTIITPQTVGGKNVGILDKTYIPWKLLRITKQQYMAEADYASLITTTPVKQLYVAFGINGVLAGGVTTCSAVITISYEVEFFDPTVIVP
jgi:hypothetical protein